MREESNGRTGDFEAGYNEGIRDGHPLVSFLIGCAFGAVASLWIVHHFHLF